MKTSGRIAISLLLPYIFLVIASTVLTRTERTGFQYNLTLFWTYRAISNGGKTKAWLIKEIAYNMLMLMPVGFLFPFTVQKEKAVKTILFGLGVSFCIELAQLFAHRGYFEFDDLLHNTAGVVIGFGIYAGIEKLRRIIQEK